MSKFSLADKYRGLEKNVWVEFIQLALEHKPLNLGQGFPDDLVPDYVLNTLSEVVREPSIFMNQYTRGFVSRATVNVLIHQISSSIRVTPGLSTLCPSSIQNCWPDPQLWTLTRRSS